MTPAPAELVELRRRCASSYGEHQVTTWDRNGKPRSTKRWMASPALVDALKAAESAWTDELWRRRCAKDTGFDTAPEAVA